MFIISFSTILQHQSPISKISNDHRITPKDFTASQKTGVIFQYILYKMLKGSLLCSNRSNGRYYFPETFQGREVEQKGINMLNIEREREIVTTPRRALTPHKTVM
jgi:hypothetical protein